MIAGFRFTVTGLSIIDNQNLFMTQDEKFMAIALDLARRGGRAVAPNPMVGAVIVKEGKIIGQGYHRYFGGPHAEVEAIRDAMGVAYPSPEGAPFDKLRVTPRLRVKGATLYVTLEPCTHFGKTPPCTRAIVEAGIGRVVVGSRDPFIKSKLPITNYQLRILEGLIAKQCEVLNKFFFKWVKTGLPYITVKVAVSADGFVAGPGRKRVQITTPEQDKEVHEVRASYQAILVGSNTVINDDPHLGVRHVVGDDPLRIILDSHLRTPLTSKVYRDANVLLVCLGTNPISKIKKYADLGISVWCAPGRKYVSLKSLFKYLGKQGISSVLVEPGPTLYRALKQLDLIDEENILRGEVRLGGGLYFKQKSIL